MGGEDLGTIICTIQVQATVAALDAPTIAAAIATITSLLKNLPSGTTATQSYQIIP